MKWSKNAVLILSVALAAELVIAGSTMALAATQKTESVNSVSFSYTSGLSSVINASLKPNLLYNSTRVSDPATIYDNITNNESIMSDYFFSSSSPVGVTVYVSIAVEVISGTSPQWQSQVGYFSYTVNFNGTECSRWVNVPFDLNGTLAHIQEVNRQLNITSGDPTIVFNATESEFIGNSIALNHTSLELAVNYPSLFFSPARNVTWQYILVGHDPNAWNNATSVIQRVIPLNNDKALLQTISYSSLAFSAAIGGTIFVGMQSGRKPNEIETFVKRNRDNIITVTIDPLSTKSGTMVNSIEEITKLSDLSGQPIFMYEGDGKCTFFAEYGSGIYYFRAEPKSNARKRYRTLRNN